MFQLFRVMHIVGVAMFFGSILAHVVAPLIPGAADNSPVMMAAREAIVLANWYVTEPGLALAIGSGALMAATTRYQTRSALALHVVAAVVIVGIAATILIPAALELEAAAKAAGAGTMTPEAFAHIEMREHVFGAVNILLALVAIVIGAALPRLRQGQS